MGGSHRDLANAGEPDRALLVRDAQGGVLRLFLRMGPQLGQVRVELGNGLAFVPLESVDGTAAANLLLDSAAYSPDSLGEIRILLAQR